MKKRDPDDACPRCGEEPVPGCSSAMLRMSTQNREEREKVRVLAEALRNLSDAVMDAVMTGAPITSESIRVRVKQARAVLTEAGLSAKAAEIEKAKSKAQDATQAELRG